MKRFILLFLLIFSVVGFADSNPDEAQLTCCDYIEISTEVTNDCCVEISVYNPYCNSGDLYVEFGQYNSSTSSYDIKATVTISVGDTARKILCPINGDDDVQYRILLKDSSSDPYCGISWIEGYNQYSGTIDLSDCCICPDHNDWLDVTVQKSDDCPNNGCKVEMHMNFPEDSADCFTVLFEDLDGNTIVPLNPTDPFEFCIDAGESGYAKAHLIPYNDASDYDTCTISQYVYCDSLPDWDTLVPNPCYPDCFDDLFTLAASLTCSVNGCSFTVWYSYREACNVWQDIQILKITPSGPNCGSVTPKELFEAAFECIVKQNVMGFNPMLGDTNCYTTWRVSASSCWTDSGESPTHPTYVQCDTFGCCLQRFEVCRDLSNNVSITPLGNAYPVTGCPSYESYDPSPSFGDCWAICDWLNLTLVLPEPQSPNDIEGKSISYEDVIIGKDGYHTVFWVTTQDEGNISIVISDIKGNIIKRYSEPTTGTYSTIYLDLSKNAVGAYFYHVKIDGRIIDSGKLLIE